MASFGANAFLSSPYLERSIGPNPQTTRGATTHVNAHPKEPRIIYPSGNFIVVKNIEDPSDCFVYRGHSNPTTVAKFSPNGFWVASADITGMVRVWAWDNPEHLTKLETFPFAGEVKDIDWDGESKKILAVGEGNPLYAKVFTWDTGNSAGELIGHAKRVLSGTIKPQRPFRIMTASEDMRTAFYTGPPFKYSHSNPTHSNFVNCIRYAPNGEFAVSVSSDKKMQFYEGKTGEPSFDVPNAHAGSIYSVAVAPTSNQVLTTSADKSVKRWEIIDGSATCVQTYAPCEGTPQLGDMQMCAIYCGEHMMSLSLNGNVNFFSSDSNLPVRIIQGHQTAVTCVSVNRESGLIYSGSTDGVVCCTDSNTGISSRLSGPSSLKSVCGGVHGGKVVDFVVCGNAQLIFVGWDDMMRIASFENNEYHTEKSCEGQPSSVACAGEWTVMASGNNVNIFTNMGNEKVGGLSGLSYLPTCVALTSDGSEVAGGGDDNKTHIYSISDAVLTEVTTIDTRSAVTAVSYHPNNQALAIGDKGRQVEVYERGSWSPIVRNKWVFHTSQVNALAWSPDGNFLASGSVDANIFIWNFNKPTAKLQIPFAHTGGVLGLDWINEERLVSVGNDNCLNLWKLKPGDVK
jgi:WD40 repeat protein